MKIYKTLVPSILLIILITLTSCEKKPIDKFISLPEEIQEAEKGNLLQVEKITEDTIFIGYYRG